MTDDLAGNRNVIEMEYAVRGAIPRRAAVLRAEGRRTILCHIGNPQALGQRPITYYRQVLGLLENPGLLGRERRLKERPAQAGDIELLPDDVLETAERILAAFEGGLGAYSESNGPLLVREAVARFIDRRDGVGPGEGVPADPGRIFLTTGASEAVKYVIEVLIAGPADGIMIPIPQYPLYSAVIRRCGGAQVDYYPDEDAGWTLDRAALEDAHARAAAKGIRVKAIVVINPGNPTGAILPAASIREVLDFAAERGLAVIADEVYQENVYGGEFVSFAKVLGGRDIPLFSVHSVSKGFHGECGHRGGYVEVRNPPHLAGTDLSFTDVLYKIASVSLCPNTVGMALVYLMVTPPAAGSPSHALFARERAHVLSELEAKAKLVREAFTRMAGVECFGRIGALYLFPRLGVLPAGKTDFDYCLALLEETGLCTVNGSGFGQRPGTQHLRVAFLPPRELLAEVLPAWIDFHGRYVAAK
ncbi:MAG: aminotransferase class I/II-fold pyridoxal phosphate-dependent enzyme [Planctomycetota bacterium]